jgi:hypothetical protein
MVTGWIAWEAANDIFGSSRPDYESPRERKKYKSQIKEELENLISIGPIHFVEHLDPKKSPVDRLMKLVYYDAKNTNQLDISLLYSVGILSLPTPTFYQKSIIDHPPEEQKKKWYQIQQRYPPKNGNLVVQYKKGNIVIEGYKWFGGIYFWVNGPISGIVEDDGIDTKNFSDYKEYHFDEATSKVKTESIHRTYGTCDLNFERSLINILQKNWENVKPF